MPLSTTNKDMFVENSINNSVSEIPARCFAISILYEDCHCETPDTRVRGFGDLNRILSYPIWVTFRLLSTCTVMLTGCCTPSAVL